MSKQIPFKSKQKPKLKPIKTTSSDGNLSAGSVYEINKQLIQSYTPLSHPELATAQTKVEDWFNMSIDSYAMLLCHERRDYTVFHLYEKQNPNPPALAAQELIGCLTDRGEVLAIDKTTDNADAWEIWLRIDNEPYCYYLFRYDNAVIEV